MGGLNVHADDQNSVSPSQKKKWYKSPKIIIGLSVLIAIPIIGTTFASTGTVVTVDPIAFGQGQQAALKCDDEVIIHPHAVYLNSAWKMDKVTISGLNTEPTGGDGAGCGGQRITLGAYDNTNSTITNSEVTLSISALGVPTVVTTSTWSGTRDADFVSNTPSQDTSADVEITYRAPVDFTSLNLVGFTIQEG